MTGRLTRPQPTVVIFTCRQLKIFLTYKSIGGYLRKKFVGPYNTNYSQMFAAIIIAIIPTVIVYCIFSNQIVDGLTAGAVKG